MPFKYHKIEWKEVKNGVSIYCSLDIAVHPAKSNVILLTIPGVDGSVDGYKNKYVSIAESVQEQHGAAVVRIANPFITSFHWETNIRRAMDFINEHKLAITGSDSPEIRVMAHSAGAAVIAQVAWEYPSISRLLLMNPASKLGLQNMKTGLSKFDGNKVTILFGSNDPSASDADVLSKAGNASRVQTIVIENVNHHFSGESINEFLKAPHAHLFE